VTRWEPVIGLEVHVQLATASKAFSASSAGFGRPPNSQTDPTVLGLPGALPSFNRRALELAIRLGLACGCTIARRSRFARKHYFYPDLPKGYQISQYDEPLCQGGAIELVSGGAALRVPLIRIHLEEDAGKNTHAGSVSLVDLNRAGVPLVEVVSEPAIGSAEEAADYMRALHQLVRWLGVSEANMEEGQLRCDANVSLRPAGSTTLGTRTELKNINSFRFVERAIEHEIARQARVLDGGGQVVQETRLWDADAGVSQSMRSKEEAEDYRYFPDPDLPPLVIDEATIDGIAAELPPLPVAAWRELVERHGIGGDEARTLTGDRELHGWFRAACAAYRGEPRAVANWMLTELLGALNRDGRGLADCEVTPAALAELLTLIDDGVISGKIAKDVFATLYAEGGMPAAIVERDGLRQVSDSSAIEAACARVVAANPRQAEQYRAGKQQLIGFFVGQVMKETGGKANPQVVNATLRRILGGEEQE